MSLILSQDAPFCVAAVHAKMRTMSDSEALKRALAYLEAGDWQAAHPIAQDDPSTLGAWAHGIVHILEGDLSNARYWYSRARREFPGAQAVREDIAALKQALESQ